MKTLSMEMLSFGRHQASKIEPKRVPGSSYLAVLWMAGCGQRDMGAVEGEMAVPGREEEQTTANGPAAPKRAEGPGGGRGGVPLKAGVGVLHGNMHNLHALRPEASADTLYFH